MDRIKKIKVKKTDGSFTDYVPIGADAEYIDMADGDTVEKAITRIKSGYAHYYNNINDMKADNKLKAGDIAVTLGYYEANDGGNGTYKIKDDSSLIGNDGSIHDLNNGLKAELIIENKINVKQFGAYGNGVADDSEAILAAIKVLPKNNAILFFPAGIYIHGDGITTGYSYPVAPGTTNQPDVNQNNINMGRNIRLSFDGFTNLTIMGDSAEIRSNDKNGEVRNNELFSFTNCNGLVIKNLTINGRRQERKVYLNDYSVFDSNSRNNIYIKNNCKNITIENVTSINSAMDGLGVSPDQGEPVQNLIIINSVFNNNHRQGFSALGIDGCKIINSDFSYNGISGDGYSGTLPKSGLDFEPGYSTIPNSNIVLDNCSFYENAGPGLVVSNYNTNIIIDNCSFSKTGLVCLSTDTIKNISMTNSIFKDVPYIPTQLDSIRNCIFDISIEKSGSKSTMLYPYDINENCNRECYFTDNIIRFSDFTSEIEIVGFRNTVDARNYHFNRNRIYNPVATTSSIPCIWLNRLGEVKENVFISDIETLNGKDVIMVVQLDETTSDYIIANNKFIGNFNNDRGLIANAHLELDSKYIKGVSLNYVSDKLYKINSKRHFEIELVALGAKELVRYGSAFAASYSDRWIHKKIYGSKELNKICEFYHDPNNDEDMYLLFKTSYVRMTFTEYNDYFNQNFKKIDNTPLLTKMPNNDISNFTLVEITQ